eukprot:230847_1
MSGQISDSNNISGSPPLSETEVALPGQTEKLDSSAADQTSPDKMVSNSANPSPILTELEQSPADAVISMKKCDTPETASVKHRHSLPDQEVELQPDPGMSPPSSSAGIPTISGSSPADSHEHQSVDSGRKYSNSNGPVDAPSELSSNPRPSNTTDNVGQRPSSGIPSDDRSSGNNGAISDQRPSNTILPSDERTLHRIPSGSDVTLSDALPSSSTDIVSDQMPSTSADIVSGIVDQATIDQRPSTSVNISNQRHSKTISDQRPSTNADTTNQRPSTSPDTTEPSTSIDMLSDQRPSTTASDQRPSESASVPASSSSSKPSAITPVCSPQSPELGDVVVPRPMDVSDQKSSRPNRDYLRTPSDISSANMSDVSAIRSSIVSVGEARIKVDRFGFGRNSVDMRQSADLRPSISESEKREIVRRDNLRTQKWISMLNDWKRFSKKHPDKVKSRIRKGIPEPVRGKVWYSLTPAEKYRQKFPDVYQKLLRREADEIEAVIIRDLDRTFPKHVMFSDKASGQTALYNVLKAYSLYDPKLGYCQGMGFVSALLLMYMGEEETFWVLVCLMRGKYQLHGCYRPGFPTLQKRFFQFERLMDKFSPKVMRHFRECDLPCMMYASQWFITVFSHSVPFDLVVRVWDVFLSEGYKVIFRVGIAMFRLYEDRLLALKFEDIPAEIKSMQQDLGRTPDLLFKEAFIRIKLSRKHLDRLDEEFIQHQKTEKSNRKSRERRKTRSDSSSSLDSVPEVVKRLDL